MKPFRFILPLTAAAFATLSFSCDDDTSQIGNSLTEGNTVIYVDSLIFDLNARGVENQDYDSRSGNLLLGSINVPEYGNLKSSFVSRMMCASQLELPDDIDDSRIDSCELVLRMTRGDIVGDSLAPQKVSVYRLNEQIPDNVDSKFDPVASFGYENMKLMGSQSFTASAMGQKDSLFNIATTIPVMVNLGRDYALEIVKEYKENPSYFQWPQTFAEKFLPGLFVETSFGRGCVANISDVYLSLYYHTVTEKKETVDDVEVTTQVIENDTVVPFSISPEVLSSNNIRFNIAQSLKDKVDNGEIILTTPGGFNARFQFPAQQIIDRYNSEERNLSLISQLSLSIPAEPIDNDYGLTVAPNILLVKTSEAEDFFLNNKLPDNLTSFTATYDSNSGQYTFSAMRNYLLNLMEKDSISDEDVDFTIIPVYLTQISQTDSYSGSVTIFTTKCSPYTQRPTMTRLHTEKALVVFSFANQIFD